MNKDTPRGMIASRYARKVHEDGSTRIAPVPRKQKTDADLSDREIKRAIDKLRGEISHHGLLRDTATSKGFYEKSARAVDARMALIRRLEGLPQFLPDLPMEMPRKNVPKGHKIPLTR